MAWFDPNNSTPFDPSKFDYKAEQNKLQLQQELAKQMMGSQMPQGQMVSGHYVAPGWGAQLASALQKVYGAYTMNQLQDQEGKLSDQSAQALAYQLQNGPGANSTPAPTAPVTQPEAVPPTDGPTYPVPTPNVAVRDLTNGDAPAAPEATPASGPLAGAIGAGPAATPAAAPAAPAAPAVPAGGPLAGAIGASSPNTGDQLAYLQKISRTGPMGQAIATGMMGRMFPSYEIQIDKDNGKVLAIDKNNPSNIRSFSYDTAGVKKDQQPALVKQMYTGVRTPEQLTAVNQQLLQSGVPAAYLTSDINVARGVGGQGEQMVKEREAGVGFDQAEAAVQQSVKRINSILNPEPGQPTINDGTGMWGGFKAALPMATDASAIRARAADAASGIVLSTMQAMKSAGVGSGAFNSDAEGKRLSDFAGSIDWTHMSTQEVTNKLSQLRNMSLESLERLKAARASTIPQGSTVASPTANPAAPKVPGRGQSVNASQWGF